MTKEYPAGHKEIIDWEDAIMSYCNKCRIRWTNCSVCEECGSKTEQFIHLEDVEQALAEKEKKCENKIELFENRMYSEERKLLNKISKLQAERINMIKGSNDLLKRFAMLKTDYTLLKAEKKEMLEKIYKLIMKSGSIDSDVIVDKLKEELKKGSDSK